VWQKGGSRRAAGHRPTASSPCPVGHPRPRGGLGTGGSAWRGGGEPAGAARAAGGLARSHVVWRRAARPRRVSWKLGKQPACGRKEEQREERLEVEDKD
jgi:hypothetical protein